MTGWVRGLAIVGLLLAGFALKGLLLMPPSLPTSVAAGEFDGIRAKQRLARILGDQRPHPVDSVANDAVRERLMTELRAIGLQPRVQEASDCSALPGSRIVSCSRVRNVLAIIAGERPGRAILLNAHYDSTPTGPGAADDGIGVATMLEVAAVLQQSRPGRPVVLLFNEGEEFGLNGASAFMRSKMARSIDALVNMESRGVSGPAVMFETSDPNGAAIAAYARAARRPHANSLSADFAKLIPNTTDVVEFKPAGWTLLNYAIIGNEARYHTPGDTVQALDPRSVQHMGEEVLATTRTLATTPHAENTGRMVYTDFAGRAFLRLPLGLAAGALALILLALAALAWRRRALGRPLALAAAMAFGGVAAAALVALGATVVRPGDFWRAYPLVTYLAVYAVLLAAMTAIWSRWGIGDRARMRAATWLLITAVGAALSLAVPGAAIFFLVAPGLALGGLVLTQRAPRIAAALLVAAILVQLLMFSQLLASIETLLVDGPLWAVAPLAALAALPALVETDPRGMRPALALLLAGAAGLWIAALLLPRASAERPAAFTIDYFRDADRRSASFAVASKQAPLPDDFPGRWERGLLPYNGRTRWISPAALQPTSEPAARLLWSVPAGSGRRVRLALSPGGANAVAIRFAEKAPVIAVGVPGRLERLPADGDPARAVLRCSGRACEGFVAELLLGSRAPIEAELIATRFGSLPPDGRQLAARRPANAHPQYGPDSTITLKRIKF
jgi:hypothetical protein